MPRKLRRRKALPTLQRLEERSLLTKLIALVDTGVDLNTGDASYTNDSPYYDLADAYNAYDGSDNVQDNNGHGTALANATVAGIQATTSQPGASGASVQILPIRDTNNSGQLDIDAIINGIFYAADKGAAVINLSFAGPSDFASSSFDALHPSTTLSQAIRYAQSKGSVVVVAAGNNGDVIGGQQYGNQDIDNETPYPVDPAALPYDDNLSNALVTASFNTSTDRLQSDSNYGPAHVPVATPGSETSFAAGYLSGVTGVIAALRPDFSYSQVINRIESTVQPVAALSGLVGTGGVVSPANAVSGLLAPGFTGAASASPATVTGTTTLLSAQAAEAGNPTLTYQWQTISTPAGVAVPIFSANGSAAAATTTATFSAAGSYTFQVTATDPWGHTATSTVTVNVAATPSSITVRPSTATLNDAALESFAAGGYDQFHNALSPQPSFSWSASGSAGGTVSASGTYTAPALGSGTDTVTASLGSLSGSATVTVTSPPPAPLTAKSLGQDGVDLVGNGWPNGNHPDGYQDIDILLSGLPSSQSIAYVDVQGYGGGEWQYNWSAGPHPHGSDFAALVRSPGATTAHLYVSPYQDENGRNYAVTLVYANGSSVQVYTNPVYANAHLPMPAATSLGQDGVDLVGNGWPNGNHPDGYQDIDILLSGLPSSQSIAYVDVQGYGGGEWQYNWSAGPHPHGSDFAALVRAPGATTAHLYVSPYQDENGRNYGITIVFADGASEQVWTGPVYAKAKLPLS